MRALEQWLALLALPALVGSGTVLAHGVLARGALAAAKTVGRAAG